MSDGRIGVNVTDGIASVVIDNPSQRNALTRAMCLELQELMPQLDADPSVIVVTLRGAGSAFSAGVAIDELQSVLLDEQPDGTVVDQLSRADASVGALTKPTVALVDGACMGGGWQLAAACDFIVASERSVIGITPAKLGVVYPRAGIERLVREVGEARAKYILFTGDTFPAARAQALGLVAEVVPDPEFEGRCAALATTIRDNSQFSVRTLKRLVSPASSDPAAVDRAWDRAWIDMTYGPDLGIGIAAFLGRQRPRFAAKR
jgi:enoyl-CoA hydratase/carnithine racemase